MIAVLASITMIVLCAPGIAIKDALLAHYVEVEADGWRVAYADAVCTADDIPHCTPEQIGTIQVVHAIQLAAIVVIAALGCAARRRTLPAITHAVDALVVIGCLGGSVGLIWWSWVHLDSTDALIASMVIPLVGGYGLKRRWSDRVSVGPVAIMTFFIIKGVMFAGGMTTAVIALKISVRESFPSSLFAGPVFMVIGGFSLAIPIAFSLLAFHPSSRDEGRNWDHLRRA